MEGGEVGEDLGDAHIDDVVAVFGRIVNDADVACMYLVVGDGVDKQHVTEQEHGRIGRQVNPTLPAMTSGHITTRQHKQAVLEFNILIITFQAHIAAMTDAQQLFDRVCSATVSAIKHPL